MPGPTTHATQQLCALQTLLYSLNGWGLHFAERSMRRTPDGFSRELKAEHAQAMRMTLVQRMAVQAFLPTEAPNDPPPALQPGAA